MLVTEKLILRCFSKQEYPDQWVAVCIDLNLAAQSESPEEARVKLEGMIKSYVKSAFEEDFDHAQDLLNRKVPLSLYVEYLKVKGKYLIHKTKNKVFSEVLPLKVA